MLKFTAIGNLGRDCETKMVGQNGDRYLCSFALGVTTGFGEKKTTLWVDCSWFGPKAEKVAPYLNKGKKIYCEGEGGIKTFEGRNGPQTVLTINITELQLIGDTKQAEGQHGNGAIRQGNGYSQGNGQKPAAPAPVPAPAPAPAPQGDNRGGTYLSRKEQLEDEIPF